MLIFPYSSFPAMSYALNAKYCSNVASLFTLPITTGSDSSAFSGHAI